MGRSESGNVNDSCSLGPVFFVVVFFESQQHQYVRNLPWLKETSTTGHLFMSYKGFYALNLHPVNRTSIEQILLRTMAFFCGQTIHFLCGSTELTFVLCAISWIVYIS